MTTRMIGGFEFVSTPEDDKKVEETVALLRAYVNAMMPLDLYTQEQREKATLDATWAVMDNVIEIEDREKAERQKSES